MSNPYIKVSTADMTEEKKQALYAFLNKNGWDKKWQCFSGNELSEKVSTMIIQGVKMCGITNDAYLYIEEHLTMTEAEDVSNFLGWCEANGKVFGSGNIQSVWSEWRKA